MSDEVQASVRQWAATVGERSGKMVEDLLEHQQGHLSMVSDVHDPADDRSARCSALPQIWWPR